MERKRNHIEKVQNMAQNRLAEAKYNLSTSFSYALA